MSRPRTTRVTLAKAERFDLWGKTVLRLTIQVETGACALYGRDGYIGMLHPDASAELHNILDARNML